MRCPSEGSAHRKRALSLQATRGCEIADGCWSTPLTVRGSGTWRKDWRPPSMDRGRAGTAGRPAGSAPDRLCVQRRARCTGHSSCWLDKVVELEFAEASPWRRSLKKTNSTYPQGERGAADGGRATCTNRSTMLERPFRRDLPALGRCVRPSRLPPDGWHATPSRNLFMIDRRRPTTAVDFGTMRWLVDEAYPDAEVVSFVLDNLNTHSSARSTKHLSRAKLGASPNASSFITLRRMAAG